MAFQMRRYLIKDGQLDQFVEDWETRVVPLREKFGFRILGAWALPESNEFVWIVGHDDFEQADRDYYESDARRMLTPNPAVRIEEASHARALQIL